LKNQKEESNFVESKNRKPIPTRQIPKQDTLDERYQYLFQVFDEK